MLRVLIIDDQPIVRDSLKAIIDWESFGFTICGEGIDGRDGLNKILTLEPDLVLTELEMHRLFGIDVIRKAKEKGFDGKFIILTGYPDFFSAQNAIRLGVSSYLLKPIDEEELIEAVEKLHNEILSEKNEQRVISD